MPKSRARESRALLRLLPSGTFGAFEGFWTFEGLELSFGVLGFWTVEGLYLSLGAFEVFRHFRTPQWPFNRALMVLNSGYLGV